MTNMAFSRIITALSLGMVSLHGEEIGVLANVNGNLTALDAVLSALKSRNIVNIVVLGDICGTGPRNDACITRLKNAEGIRCLSGAWDLHFAGTANLASNDPDFIWFLEWSKGKISKENETWLRNLPPIINDEKWSYTYGQFTAGSHASFPKKMTDVRASFDGLYRLGKKLGFVGGNGNPTMFFDSNPIVFSQDQTCTVDQKTGTILNVGSVGEPKDDDNRSCFAIYNGKKYELIRLKYDIETEATEMIRNGYPQGLIDRIRLGR